MIIQRIRQFWRAVNASLNADDTAFVKANLNEVQQRLFFSMNVFDQRHVLNTAYTALKIQRAEQLPLDEKLLIRACLLHDIARTRADICIWDKVANVLLAHFAPHRAKQIASAAASLKDEHRSFGAALRRLHLLLPCAARRGKAALARHGRHRRRHRASPRRRKIRRHPGTVRTAARRQPKLITDYRLLLTDQ